MQTKLSGTACAATMSLLILATGARAAAVPERSYSLAGLTADKTLVLFSSATPGTTREVKLAGLTEPVLGIDTRPLDGALYGITASDKLVRINPRSGKTTPVSSLSKAVRGGEASGLDFNPQADRLRLVGAVGQNLRIQVIVGAVAVDGQLAFAADDPNAGKRPRISAVAYTNAFANAPTTAMFDIDFALDVLVRQDPPNDGLLRTVGPLGVDCGEASGFDIASPEPGVDDALAICGQTLYRIDLATGAAAAIAVIGGEVQRYLGLAVLTEPKR